jgi:hypothetical protein
MSRAGARASLWRRQHTRTRAFLFLICSLYFGIDATCRVAPYAAARRAGLTLPGSRPRLAGRGGPGSRASGYPACPLYAYRVVSHSTTDLWAMERRDVVLPTARRSCERPVAEIKTSGHSVRHRPLKGLRIQKGMTGTDAPRGGAVPWGADTSHATTDRLRQCRR